MPDIDLSKNWAVIAPADAASAFAAAEIARIFRLLRDGTNFAGLEPPVFDAAGDAPEDSRSVIVLNPGDDPRGGANGYSWRAGAERIEIFGDSGRGLLHGTFSFLSALGVRWPEPGVELLPLPVSDAPYRVLESRGEYRRASAPGEAKRLAISGDLPYGRPAEILRFAVRNRYDAVIFPRPVKKHLLRGAERYCVQIIEEP